MSKLRLLSPISAAVGGALMLYGFRSNHAFWIIGLSLIVSCEQEIIRDIVRGEEDETD